MKTGYSVGDCMTEDPLTTTSETSIKDCAALMRKHKLGSIIIVENKKPIGILTNQDIVFRVVAKGVSLKKPVLDYMSSTIITVSPNIDIFEALEVMNKNMIRHISVVKSKKLVGYLTLKDILKIEPTLFDLYADKMDIRISGDNKISPLYEDDGICAMCGSYTKKLYDVNGTEMCSVCKKNK
jgi:signal-transduction protein with cAMP-binding, CBS, and nucleotidyltransferase domain